MSGNTHNLFELIWNIHNSFGMKSEDSQLVSNGMETFTTCLDEAVGVYRLSRGELVSLSAGTLTYQLDFAIEDQLRIVR